MGRPKLLLPLGDRTVLGYCLDALAAPGVAERLVVAAPADAAVQAEAEACGARVVMRLPGETPDMAGSVRSGFRAAAAAAAGFLVLPADHPLVRRQTVAALAAAFQAAPSAILLPRYRGRRGHPALFPRAVLETLAPGLTLRDLLRRHAALVREVPVTDPGIFLDIDTPADYRRCLGLAALEEG